jgi:hypothetical protein
MRGINAGTDWEHLIPGFIIAGAGIGTVNPPLASTAIGVVTPDRAGMASGINSTFRQVGTATGIAALGSLFTHTITSHVISGLTGITGVSSEKAHSLAAAVAHGGAASTGTGLPPTARAAAQHVVASGFVAGLDQIILVGALVVFVGALAALTLIRTRDFDAAAAHQSPRASSPGDGVRAASSA